MRMSLSISNPVIGGRQRGFTLIELMIAVAVVAILVAIAVPAYNDQVRRTRRADAKGDMMGLVLALERAHTVNGTYAGFPTASVPSPATGTAAYNIVPSGLTATTYTLTATPVGDQANDTRCGNMILTQVGNPTFSSGASVADCWSR